MVLSLQNLDNIFRMPRNVCDPLSEPSVSIHGSDPFGQEFTFRLLLLVILTFYLQNQCFAVRQSHGERVRHGFCRPSQPVSGAVARTSLHSIDPPEFAACSVLPGRGSQAHRLSTSLRCGWSPDQFVRGA